jgi:hypothetical protein
MIFFTTGLGGGGAELIQSRPASSAISSTAPTSKALPKCPSDFSGPWGDQEGFVTIVFII